MEDTLHRLIDRLYGRPLIRNVLRGELVEQIILDALGRDWQPADDYASWDVEHRPSGTRIQIKQSAARQSWSDAASVACVPRYSIGARHGYSTVTNRWSEARQRHAQIYIFAWHPRTDESADHRVASQWQFHVIGVDRLPPAASIGLSALAALAPATGIDGLAPVVRILM